MSDILSIIGIAVSTIGVIISLIFFNASIDNSRKVLINRVLYFINFDHEIMSLFVDSTKNRRFANTKTITRTRIEKFNQSMLQLESMLKEIYYNNKFGVPLIGESDCQIENNKYKHTYLISKTFELMNQYFRERNLPNFYLMINEWDDRCLFLQHYNKIIKYKRKFLIGPINGITFTYKRKNKTVTYGKTTIPLIKKIKTEDDFRKYYNECYSKLDILDKAIIESCERELLDLEIITDKENQIPITIYR